MFGLFTDNKPNIIKAINLATVKEVENFEVVKKAILQIINDNQNAVSYYELMPLEGTLFLGDKSFSLPKASGTVTTGSSREMFQALNQISKNAEYDAERDYANVDIGDFSISLMKIKHSNQISIMVSLTNARKILYQFIRDNGGKTFNY